MAIAMQWCGKHFSSATNKHTTEKSWKGRFLCSPSQVRAKEADSSESEAGVSSYQHGVFSCIVRHHYQAVTNEGMEDLVICGACRLLKVL
jgi:hypothetical protein